MPRVSHNVTKKRARFLVAARLEKISSKPIGYPGRVPAEVIHDDLLSALSAATDSASSQHALLTWRTSMRFEEKDSIFDEQDSMVSLILSGASPVPSPAYIEVAECIRLAISSLADEKARNNRSVQRSLHSEPNVIRDRQIQHIFGLLQAACEVLEHLGSHGSLARAMLRTSGVVEVCFDSIAAIRNYAARRNDEKLGTDALAAAVATLRRVSIVAGHADPNP